MFSSNIITNLMEVVNGFDPKILFELVKVKMPFGRFENYILCDLPISYLEWFLRKDGFPEGKLGQQLATVYEIKLNGLEEIFLKLKKLKM